MLLYPPIFVNSLPDLSGLGDLTGLGFQNHLPNVYNPMSRDLPVLKTRQIWASTCLVFQQVYLNSRCVSVSLFISGMLIS